MWQDQAWREWFQRFEKRLPREVSRALAAMPRNEQAAWLRHAERPLHPVAAGVAAWLSRLVEAKPWYVFAGDRWTIWERPPVVLMSYPEHLGQDPLAMCALGALWAQSDDQRWALLVERLGPLTILGPWQGQLESVEVSRRLDSFCEAYAAWDAAWNFRQLKEELKSAAPACAERWPPVPDYSAYREQLLYGVVPHEVSGRPIHGEWPVLLALLEVPDEARHVAAPLAYKALESLWLTQAWERYARGEAGREG
ncbi:MAG: hypothetical protein OWU84_05370 [Firmicutes bacterium]|nr:hypothetical protein [Bacillota bacterium]